MISKNVFYNTEDQIKNEMFLEKVHKYISQLNKTLK